MSKPADRAGIDRPDVALLSLRQAAELLGVHYMTVYRHVRLGMLPAHKVGGSWRIDFADLASSSPAPPDRAAHVGADLTPSTSSRSRRSAPWVERLGRRMLVGDRVGAWQVVEAAMTSGVEPQDVYVEILGPALHAIGAAWAEGRIGIDQEHLASGVAASIIGTMGPRFRRRGRPRGSVMITMPPGERHGLGVAMLGDILAQAGFEVLNLGPDTPAASLAAAISQRDDLSAVVISVVDTSRLVGALRLAAAARRANPGVLVVAGGFAISDAATAERIGADVWASDPRQLAGMIAGFVAR